MSKTAVSAILVALTMTTVAVAAPPAASAPKTHHAHRQPPAFPMGACIKSAERVYNPSEAKAVCDDLKAGA